MRVAMALAASLAFTVSSAALSTAPVPSGVVPAAESPADADRRFAGPSPEAFAESRAAFESEMGEAARLAFQMKLAQVRAKLAEQSGRPLTDAEFAAALDGKTLADLDAMADAAPTHITIDIETSDDT